MDTPANRIKQALEIRNMKQADLVRLTGIGKSSISTYISGDYEPKQKNIYKIAAALNVNEAWLMGLDVPMEKKEAPPLNLNENASKKYEKLLELINLLSDEEWEKVMDYAALLLSAQQNHKDE